MSKYDKWLMIKDAAKKCEVSQARISQILKKGWAGGKFRTATERGHVVINPDDLERFIRERKVGNPTAMISKVSHLGGLARAKKLSQKRRSEISAYGAQVKKEKMQGKA